MSWNYRMVCTFRRSGNNYSHMLEIHEVYYDDKIPVQLTANGVSPSGKNTSDLIDSWAKYRDAFNKQVLFFNQDMQKFVKYPPAEILHALIKKE